MTAYVLTRRFFLYLSLPLSLTHTHTHTHTHTDTRTLISVSLCIALLREDCSPHLLHTPSSRLRLQDPDAKTSPNVDAGSSLKASDPRSRLPVAAAPHRGCARAKKGRGGRGGGA